MWRRSGIRIVRPRGGGSPDDARGSTTPREASARATALSIFPRPVGVDVSRQAEMLISGRGLRPMPASMVKIFLDTANIDEIREAASWGVLDGVTTNPTLVAKTGRKWSEVIQDILALVDGPISLEVTTTAGDEMIKQGRQLAKLHKNVVVKIQMTTEGLKAIKALSSEGVKINTTLIFSANQAILAAKAGAKYVSPVLGRLDDMGQDGMQVIREIAEIFGNYEWDCEILVASIRHPLHVIEAAKLGADIVTLPFDVLKKMTQHALTDVGLKRFLDDWQKVPK